MHLDKGREIISPMNEIRSYKELISTIRDKTRAYLLLYKPGSEPNECAFRNISEAAGGVEDVEIMVANVAAVRDIHPNYPVNSVPSLLVFEHGEFKNVIKGCNENNYYKTLFDDAVFAKIREDEGTRIKNVTVYSTPTCSWCTTLKTYLKKQRIPYSEIDVSRDQNAAEEMVRRSGQQGVPQTDIEGEMIVGFNKARINELLGIGDGNNN
jgi:glutaredoxin-like YruB-family protein